MIEILFTLLTLNVCSDFFQKTKEIYQSIDETTLVDRVCDSNMYFMETPSESDYVQLFSYILFCRNEDGSEGIGYRVYEMIKNFPERWNVLMKYTKQIPDKRLQKKATDYFIMMLCFNFDAEIEMKGEIEFLKMFPFIKKNHQTKSLFENSTYYQEFVIHSE